MQATTTHIDHQRTKANRLKVAVMRILDWTELEYCEFQYLQGIAYLRWYLPADEQACQRLQRSRLYWNWWKSCWLNRDEVFVEAYRDALHAETYQVVYRELHNARELVQEIYPTGIIMADASEPVASIESLQNEIADVTGI